MVFRLTQFETELSFFLLVFILHRKLHTSPKEKPIKVIYWYLKLIYSLLRHLRNATKWEFFWFPISLSLLLSLSCPLAFPVGSCPPPVINLKQDVSRQLSSQSLLSLLRYRSVLCYRLSWLLSLLLMFLPRGEKETASAWIYRGLVFKWLTITSQWK